jgi:hypothetical protein
VNSRYTLILLLIFIGLVAFAVTQRDAEPMQLGEGAPTPTPEDLLEINASDIEEVSVEGESGSYVLSRVSGGWEVDGDAAADEVDGLVTRLANPSVTRELPADRDPEIYGFAAPTLTVTLGTAVGDTYVILVGDEVPGGYDRYVGVTSAVWWIGSASRRLPRRRRRRRRRPRSQAKRETKSQTKRQTNHLTTSTRATAAMTWMRVRASQNFDEGHTGVGESADEASATGCTARIARNGAVER